MPTLALKVQQDGTWRGWSGLVGATRGYLAVDDSSGVAHDGDATYLLLGTLNLGLMLGRVSFPLFLQAQGLNPTSITLNVAAEQGSGSHPNLQIGFIQGGLAAFDPAGFVTTGAYQVATRTFSTNPISGAPWVASDLIGLEACVQSQVAQQGTNRVTLVSASLTYVPTLSYLVPPEPQGAMTS
jgi:hypothetical protein